MNRLTQANEPRPASRLSRKIYLLTNLAVALLAQALLNIAAAQAVGPRESQDEIISNSPNSVLHAPSVRPPRQAFQTQFARTNLIHTTNGRQSIFNKLARIRFDTVSFDNLPLGEVVRFLREKTRVLDPEGRGVNFVVLPSLNLTAAAPPQGTAGVPNAASASPAISTAEPLELNGLPINLPAPLEDIRLLDVLDVLTKIAPIRYSVEDYGVVFRLKTRESDSLYVRTYKVDPNTFNQGLESVVGFPFGSGAGAGQAGQGVGILTIPRVSVAPTAGAAGAGTTGIGGGGIAGVTRPALKSGPSGAVIGYFSSLGVDLTPPKSAFFNDREGTLVVRATAEDLDTISAALQGLNSPGAGSRK